MANKKAPGFVLEKDQKEIIDELTNEEAGIIFKAIFEYEETKEIPKLDKTLRIVFKQFKIRLDNYDEAYEQRCLKNKENVEKRWAKYKEENDTVVYDGIRANTNYTNKREREIKINKIKINKREGKENKEKEVASQPPTQSTTAPTLEKIISFGASLGVDEYYCTKFFNHYQENGWRNGQGNLIDDWQSVFNNWVNNDLKKGNIKKLPGWFGKEIKKEEYADNEVNEIEELLAEFK